MAARINQPPRSARKKRKWIIAENNRRLLSKQKRAIPQAWTPAQLFSNGQQGVWYEPKPQYLFQDADGTVPVTADGDPVGLMVDLSGNGNHATQATSAARPIYRTDGVLHWIGFDGVDDWLTVAASEGWVKFMHDGAGGTYIHSGQKTPSALSVFAGTSLSSNQNGFTLYSQENDNFRNAVLNSEESIILGNSPSNLSTSSHVADVVTGVGVSPNWRLSVNASLEFSANYSGTPSDSIATNALRIGARADGSPSLFMSGKIHGMALIKGSEHDMGLLRGYFANLAGVTL